MPEKVLFRTIDVTVTSTTDLEGVGTFRWVSGSCFLWTKNAEAATALTVGQICCHQPANGVDFLKTVLIPVTADLGTMAGVVMATSLAAGSYGWIQVFGYATSVSATASGVTNAAGAVLAASNGVAYGIIGTVLGIAPKYHRQIILMTAIASATTVAGTTNGFVHCL